MLIPTKIYILNLHRHVHIHTCFLRNIFLQNNFKNKLCLLFLNIFPKITGRSECQLIDILHTMEQNWNSYPWNKNVKSMFETANCQFLVSITSKCFSYACNHQSSLAVLAMWIPWLSFIVLKKEYEKTYDRLFQSKLAISNGSSADFSQNWHLWCVLLSSFVL